MFQSLSSWLYGSHSTYCSKEFPLVWSSFVDAFTDTIQAQGRASPAPHQQGEPQRTFLPAAERLIAIGDLHGDMSKARRAFRLGGLIDSNDRWSGGNTTAVQVGDQLDRGDHEIEILYFLERLQQEAHAAGGALHVLTGNHETMNAQGRFRYATMEGTQLFQRWQRVEALAGALKAKCGCQVDGAAVPHPVGASTRDAAVMARLHALRPGGPLATRFLAPHPVVLQVGSTLFVHGGVLPEHAEYGLERINQETSNWLLGKVEDMPEFLAGRSGVVWAREYSAEDARRCDCDTLRRALAMVPGAARMVVGHTIQDRGINAACDKAVYRIDVGLSKGCGNGHPEVLEIVNDKHVWLLREGSQPIAYSQDPDGPAKSLREERNSRWAWAKTVVQPQATAGAAS